MDETQDGAWRTLAIKPHPERLQALHEGHLVADSTGAVLVRQAGQDDVFYFPMEDVEMTQMARTDHRTVSALGEASYWTFARDGKIWENGVWSYEKPATGAEALQGLVAFRPDIVEIHFVGHEGGEMMWDREAEKMGDYIRHTDSGSGASQEAPWTPTVHNARD